MVSQEWKGYLADDLTVEFTMLDPYIRQPLLPLHQGTHFQGWYSATFKCPD
jgi:hypothetical protein